MNIPYLGEISAFLTACLWSGSSLAFASATRRLGSVRANVSRLIVAAILLTLIVLVAGLEIHLSQKQILYLSFSGILGITLGDSFLFKAYQQMGPRITSLVMALNPAFAAVLAFVVLGEGLGVTGVLGIFITIAGVGIVVSEPKAGAVEGSVPVSHFRSGGMVLALLAAAGQGSGLVIAKMAFQEAPINGFVATTVRVLASLVPLLPAAIITGRFRSPITSLKNDPQAFQATMVGSILGPVLGITLSLVAIGHSKVGVAATIMGLVPILMLPLVRFIHKEHLHWRAIVGAFVAFFGVAVLFWH